MIKIDQAAGKIAIKHGPLKQFEMDEGMTMLYRADDSAGWPLRCALVVQARAEAAMYCSIQPVDW